MVWARIRGRQPGRPERLAQVARISHRRVFNPVAERELGQRLDGSALLLSNESHRTRNHAQDKKRPFLQKQAG